MMNLSERQTRWLFGSVGVGAFVMLLALEILTQKAGFTFLELLLEVMELLLTIAAAGGVALLFQRIHAHHEEKMELIRDLESARAEGESWRSKVQSHLEGIGAAIDDQFKTWDMTEAERDVGLLILKGLSHKEIAVLRSTNDATVRQQAKSIYHKSGLSGKAAFAAYFLEDLLPPSPSDNAAAGQKTDFSVTNLTDREEPAYAESNRARR